MNLSSLLKEFTQSSSATSGLTNYGTSGPKKKKKQLTSLIALLPFKKAQVDDAAHEAATSPFNLKTPPSVAQQHAGNYPKGHLSISGVDISIENPQFSARRGKDWVQEMTAHYGYILGTVGSDGDHVDCFVRAGTDDGYQGPVFVVNQNNQAGNFDEHKCFIGWATKDQAQRAYENNYQLGWQGLDSIVELTWEGFKEWLSTGNHKVALQTKKFELQRILAPVHLLSTILWK